MPETVMRLDGELTNFWWSWNHLKGTECKLLSVTPNQMHRYLKMP